MEVHEITGQEAIEGWEGYVHSNTDATHYHQWGWRNVIQEAFGHSPRYFMAYQGDRAQGILPLVLMRSRLFGRFLVSLPFVNYGGLLTINTEAAQSLLGRAQALVQEAGAAYIELRHRQPRGMGLQPKQHKVSLVLDLPGSPDRQWKNFDCKLRNQVRKAEKSKLYPEWGREECLEAFYRVFARTMRDLGTPVYPKGFFRSILHHFPSAKIVLIKKEKAAIAAGFMLSFRDTMEVPWAGSLQEYRPLCPNMLLYWEVIKQAIQDGVRVFDFGRSTPGEGTYRFKLQWGAVPIPLTWEYWSAERRPLPDLSPQNPKYHHAIRIWKRLPMVFANYLGPMIVKNIP